MLPNCGLEEPMNVRLANQDLTILQAEARRPRFGQSPGWSHVSWEANSSGGHVIFLRQFSLPGTCSVRRTDLRIEAPANLYEPAQPGRLHFYRNLWITPGIRLHDRRNGAWLPMPRLHTADSRGWAYLCIHPDDVAPGTNILAFLRTLDIYLLNPGYKAEAHELA